MRAPSPAVAGARVTANGDSRYTCDLTSSKVSTTASTHVFGDSRYTCVLTSSKVSNVCSKAATCAPLGPLWQARAW